MSSENKEVLEYFYLARIKDSPLLLNNTVLATEVKIKTTYLLQQLEDTKNTNIPDHIDELYQNDETRVALVDFILDLKQFGSIKNELRGQAPV